MKKRKISSSGTEEMRVGVDAEVVMLSGRQHWEKRHGIRKWNKPVTCGWLWGNRRVCTQKRRRTHHACHARGWAWLTFEHMFSHQAWQPLSTALFAALNANQALLQVDGEDGWESSESRASSLKPNGWSLPLGGKGDTASCFVLFHKGDFIWFL